MFLSNPGTCPRVDRPPSGVGHSSASFASNQNNGEKKAGWQTAKPDSYRLTRHRSVYFTVWMITPSKALAGMRPADHLKGGPAPLLRALESYRWR